MTLEFLSPESRKAIAEALNEHSRITKKYKHHKILDDGLNDALKFARVELACAEAQGRPEQAKRWRQAMLEARISGRGNLSRLALEIENEGHEMSFFGKGDESWETYGKALLNLASSL